MKRLAIINPWSGHGKTGRMLSIIQDALKNIASEQVITRYPGHCKEAAQAGRDFDSIIAVGGDGTICEVVNGMDFNRQTLAIIPSGTGNSLARDFNLHTLAQSVAIAANAAPSLLDLVKFNFTTVAGKSDEWYCTSTASMGYAARVTLLANRRLKKLGVFCYPVASLACALFPQRMPAQIAYDNGTSSQKLLTGIMIQNARHAANFELFPFARLDDGLFDVMELNAGFAQQTLHNISVLSRLHFYMPGVVRRAAAMRITPESPQTLMIDGEIIPDITDLTITIVPAKLKCCLKI
jgi:diacylglycerol kinase family enzyme